MASDEDSEIDYALVCLKTGTVLEFPKAPKEAVRMQDLASATPELFRCGNCGELRALFERLGSDARSDSFQEIVFVSQQRAHIVQRVAHRPDVALLAISQDARKLGLMLSGVRARLLLLGSEKESAS